MENTETIKVWKDGDFALVETGDKQKFLDAGWSDKAPSKAKQKVEPVDDGPPAAPVDDPETLEKSAASEAPKPIKRGRPRKS